jgi:diguanylate cyclase (GGDEF)-like protein
MSTTPKIDAQLPRLQNGPDRTGAGLWDELRQALLADFSLFEEAAVSLLSGTLSPEARDRVAREAHKMVGSLGVLGMTDGARISRDLERILQKNSALGEADLLQVSNGVVALRRLLEQAPEPGAPGQLRRGPETTILVIDADQELARRLALEAVNLGLHMTITGSADVAREAMANGLPDCVMLDPYLAGGKEEGFAILSELTELDGALPIVCLLSHPSIEDRLEAASRGASLVLQKPVSPAEAIEFVQRLVDAEKATRATALVLSDEPSLLNKIEQSLMASGIRSVGLSNPAELWKPSHLSKPDLLILDAEMQAFDPLNLCRALQSDTFWSAVPVMILVRQETDTAQRFISAGADDCISRDFEANAFAARVRRRLHRNWQLRIAAMDKSTLLGPALSYKSMNSTRPEKGNEVLCLVDVEIDHLERIIERHGLGAASRVHRRLAHLLQEKFRCEHLVTRWRGDEFVFEVQESTRANVVHDVSTVLETLREEAFASPSGEQFQVTASAGIAQYALDGADYQTLYGSSHEALGLARQAGGDRVMAAASHAEQAKDAAVLDVLVVDDDEAVGRVLLHTLQTRGYRAGWLRNGTDALEKIQAGSVKPRVLLLDVSLPGIDGFSLLKQVTSDGSVSSMRVIMLTARSGEAEVLKALEWGAFDHVSKPFSLPVLIQRVRRALEA